MAASTTPGPVPQLAIEAADLPGDLPIVGKNEQLEVRRQRRQPAGPARLCVSSSRHWPSSLPSATTSPRNRGCVEARCASARPELIVFPVPTADASTPEPTTFSAAISRWRPSSTGSSASGRASVIRTTCRAPAESVTFGSRALERAQLGDRLLGDHPPGASPTRRRRS